MRTTRKGKRKKKGKHQKAIVWREKKKGKKEKETTRNKVDQQGKGGENISDKKGTVSMRYNGKYEKNNNHRVIMDQVVLPN